MPKATNPEKLARVEEVMKIILYGGEIDDIRQYANSKGWSVSDSTLWRYKRAAFAILRRRTVKNHRELLARHFGTRRVLLARAMEAGDWRVALSVVQDEARLQGLYPEKTHKHELSGKDGAPLPASQVTVNSTGHVTKIWANMESYSEEIEAALKAEKAEDEADQLTEADFAAAGFGRMTSSLDELQRPPRTTGAPEEQPPQEPESQKLPPAPWLQKQTAADGSPDDPTQDSRTDDLGFDYGGMFRP